MKNLKDIIEDEGLDVLQLTFLIAPYNIAIVGNHTTLKEVMIDGWVPDKEWVKIVDINDGITSNERWVKPYDWAVIYLSEDDDEPFRKP